MFWPWPERKFGLYLEPRYDYGLGHGHELSVSITGDILIQIHGSTCRAVEEVETGLKVDRR